MPQKTDEPEKALAKVVTELGRYPMEAFEFLQEGLEYTVRKIHGPPEPGLRKVV